jgi:hypothetical protein
MTERLHGAAATATDAAAASSQVTASLPAKPLSRPLWPGYPDGPKKA